MILTMHSERSFEQGHDDIFAVVLVLLIELTYQEVPLLTR